MESISHFLLHVAEIRPRRVFRRDHEPTATGAPMTSRCPGRRAMHGPPSNARALAPPGRAISAAQPIARLARNVVPRPVARTMPQGGTKGACPIGIERASFHCGIKKVGNPDVSPEPSRAGKTGNPKSRLTTRPVALAPLGGVIANSACFFGALRRPQMQLPSQLPSVASNVGPVHRDCRT